MRSLAAAPLVRQHRRKFSDLWSMVCVRWCMSRGGPHLRLHLFFLKRTFPDRRCGRLRPRRSSDNARASSAIPRRWQACDGVWLGAEHICVSILFSSSAYFPSVDAAACGPRLIRQSRRKFSDLSLLACVRWCMPRGGEHICVSILFSSSVHFPSIDAVACGRVAHQTQQAQVQRSFVDGLRAVAQASGRSTLAVPLFSSIVHSPSVYAAAPPI